MSSPLCWPVIGTKKRESYRVFDVVEEKCVSPRTNQEHDFFVIKCASWVNAIALTPEEKIIMVRQYRHGIKKITLELPGGILDQEDTSPALAALRELEEETGYTGAKATQIAQFYPNPAVQENTVYSVLVEGCTLSSKVNFDETEDIQTVLYPLAQIHELIDSGELSHALNIAALYHYFRLAGK